MKVIKPEENEVLVSHDVVAMFPRIPILESMKIIRECLEEDNI